MKKKRGRRSLSLLLAAVVLFTGLPLSQDTGAIALAAESRAGETITISDTQTLSDRTISGAEGSAAVIVKNGATLTLSNVTVNAAQGQSAVYIEKNATLIIEGTVRLNGGNAYFEVQTKGSGSVYAPVGAGAGIEVPSGASLTLKGGGTLHATGGNAGDGMDAGTAPDGSYENWRGGAGGGGAGAGIGGKGGSTESTTGAQHVGTITIDDKNLLLYANGGKGGNGGSGADGTDGGMIGTPKITSGIYVVACHTDIRATFEGGTGGGGGGGGGYPGAGIGSGGTAGKSGKSGGQPGQDEAYSLLIVGPGFIQHREIWSASGGGGGAGGRGYVSGGGGGAGANSMGELHVEPGTALNLEFPKDDLKGYGGGPGEDGKDPIYNTYTFRGLSKSKTSTTAKSGKSGGQAGQAGIAEDSEKKATAGSSDPLMDTLSGNVGEITIRGGLVFATGGGKNTGSAGFSAMNIGNGGCGGPRQQTGTLKILGGSLHTTDNILTPVNASGQQLYPVTVRPLNISPTDTIHTRPTVHVDGTDWNISRFNNSSGDIILWLPNSPADGGPAVPYEVTIDLPTYSVFNVTVVDGQADVTSTQKAVYTFDMMSHRLYVSENTWSLVSVYYNLRNGADDIKTVQTGAMTENTEFILTWTDKEEKYPNDGIMLVACYNYGWVCIQSGGNYDITLQDCVLEDFVIDYTNSNGVRADAANVTINLSGTENTIENLTNKGFFSTIALEGDEDSALNVTNLISDMQASLTTAYSGNYTGTLEMNSSGKVSIGTVRSERAVVIKPLFSSSSNYFGTPNFLVNNGFIHFANGIEEKDFSGGLGGFFHYRLGDLEVNGGTLKVGDGTGRLASAQENSISEGNVDFRAGRGNLLCGDVPYNATSQAAKEPSVRVEITGLPANRHFTAIPNSVGDGVIGGVEHDFWTDDSGKLAFFVNNNSESQLTFTCENGDAYVYKITAQGGRATAERQTLPALPSSLEGGKLQVYTKYYVYNDTLYSRPSATLSGTNVLNNVDIAFMETTDLILDSTATPTYNIKSVTGDGTLTIKKDATIQTIDVSGLKVEKTSLDADTVTCDSLNIDGIVTVKDKLSSPSAVITSSSSVKAGETYLPGVTNGSQAVYLAVLPLEPGLVYANGSIPYNIMSGSHGDGKSYIYVPEDVTYLTTAGGERKFYVSLNEDTQTFDVREVLIGDGQIDLSKGSAEIWADNSYVYNGQEYENCNGSVYVITGESSQNTLTISGGNPQITLDNVKVSADTSPIAIQAGASAVIELKGENTLTGGAEFPAIRVSDGAAVTIRGEGILHAFGGQYASAVGGAYQENNGKITIEGGTLNLYGSGCVALGAGYDGITPEGSIVIAGGAVQAENSSGGAALGATPQNEDGEKVFPLMFPVDAEKISIDGKDIHALASNADGVRYLYVLKKQTVITADGEEYTAMPLTFGETENGRLQTSYELNGTQVPIATGDMIMEGMTISLTATPAEGYGLRSGPVSGNYEIKLDDGQLILSPVSGLPETIQSEDSWEPVAQAIGEEETYVLAGIRREIGEDAASVINLGAAARGTAVFDLTAHGEGVKAELIIDGEVAASLDLSDTPQTLSHTWTSDGNERVSLRFSGSGTATITSLILGTETPVSDVRAVFDPIHTITWKDPSAGLDVEAGETKLDYTIDVLRENGTQLIDRNPSMAGFQVFEDDTISLRFMDYSGGNIFDSFTLSWKSGKTEIVTQQPYTFTVNQDVTLDIAAHKEPYFVVVIPEKVAVPDEGTTSALITASRIGNMAEGDTLDIIVKGLDENGNATLKRSGAENDTLTVPVTDKDGKAMTNGGIVAQFANNNTTPLQGGTISFGAPTDTGHRKAGKYTGTITFTIAYKKEQE